MTSSEHWMPVELRAVRDLTPTVREFRLAYPHCQAVAPGAHLQVRVRIGEVLDKRSYSIVTATNDGELTIAVKQLAESRGGSRHMWSLRPGARLYATSPVSAFDLSHAAPHYLLIAGGIGVTPIVSMARTLAARGASLRMVYAARGRDEFAYLPELVALLGDRLELFAAGEHRMLDMAHEIAALPPGGEAYMCGPIGMMDALRAEWARQGRPAALLRFETFGSSGHHAAQAFTVKIPRLALEVHVPQGRSMLDALAEAGVAVLSECRRGECGLCALDVIVTDAEIDHRDVFLSSAERAQNRRVCACVSRVAGGCISVEPAWRGDPNLSAVELCEDLITRSLASPDRRPDSRESSR